MANNDLGGRIVEELRGNGRQLALISAAVFLITFLIIVISRCGKGEQEISRDPDRYSISRKTPQRITTRSGSSFLDSTLPLATPGAEFSRTPGSRTPALKPKKYTLSERELYQPLTAATNRTLTNSSTNISPAGGKDKKVPEIDMILKRPPSGAGKRADY